MGLLVHPNGIVCFDRLHCSPTFGLLLWRSASCSVGLIFAIDTVLRPLHNVQ